MSYRYVFILGRCKLVCAWWGDMTLFRGLGIVAPLLYTVMWWWKRTSLQIITTKVWTTNILKFLRLMTKVKFLFLHEHLYLWLRPSEISLQRQHRDRPWNACRIRLTSVGTLFDSIHHINNQVFWGAVSFHIERHHQLTSIGSWAFIRAAYPSFCPYDFIFLWSNPDICFLQCANKSIPYPSPSTWDAKV